MEKEEALYYQLLGAKKEIFAKKCKLSGALQIKMAKK
jgi:hypothetical protein